MLISSFHLYRDKRGVVPIRLPESGQRWRKWGDSRALQAAFRRPRPMARCFWARIEPGPYGRFPGTTPFLRPAHHQSTYLVMRSGLVTWVWAGGLLQRSQDSALRQAAFQSRMGAFPTIQPRAW